MRILVINGSPKGENSVTLQTVRYLEKRFPSHSFTYMRISQPEWGLFENTDLILFSYPVYTFLVPSQLHRFIERMKDQKLDLAGKYATQITTSKHFYDVTAHRFILDNCLDMGLRFILGLSADMDDLTKPQGQADADAFFLYVVWCMENGIHEPEPKPLSAPKHIPAHPAENVPKGTKTVALAADLAPEDVSLRAMAERFRNRLPYETKLVNLRDFHFRGGCLSCFHCATDGKCVYTDGFDALLREQIQTCDAIVLAFTIRDHSMGSLCSRPMMTASSATDTARSRWASPSVIWSQAIIRKRKTCAW